MSVKRGRTLERGYRLDIAIQIKESAPVIVAGTNGSYYKLTVDHAANTDNKPVTGSQWYGFWELTTSAQTHVWASGTAYRLMQAKDISGISFVYGVKDAASNASYAFSLIEGSIVDSSQGRVNFVIPGSMTSSLSPFNGEEEAAMIDGGSYTSLFRRDFNLTWAVVDG